MAKKKGEHYVNNKEFYVLLVENKKLLEAIEIYSRNKEVKELVASIEKTKTEKEKKKIIKKIETLKEYPIKNKKQIDLLEEQLRKIKNKLGRIFLRICKGFLSKPNFINYSWDRKDIMTSDACWFMSNYIDRYNVERTNPFAYFTQICRNAFLQHINKYKKTAETFQNIGFIENIMHKNNQQSDEWNT